jgi:hypothetical protein
MACGRLWQAGEDCKIDWTRRPRNLIIDSSNPPIQEGGAGHSRNACNALKMQNGATVFDPDQMSGPALVSFSDPMLNFFLSPLETANGIEIVERKGTGQPDSICDALAETLSRNLCLEYKHRCSEILHHNVDKACCVLIAPSRPLVEGV